MICVVRSFRSACRRCLQAVCLVGLFSILFTTRQAIAQSVELSNSDKQDANAVQRFLSVLESNPQRGTAFDFVYSYHVERGTLDHYVSSLVERARKNENDGAAWLILGMMYSQRRNEQQAIDAFSCAQRLREGDANPPFYCGQSLFRLGEYSQAIGAFEQAIERRPNRALLVEIIEQLGRCHERLHQSDAAIKTWTRMEEQFPNDLRVLERIAMIQQQEGAFQEALGRYERLAKLATDGYQRIQYRLEAALILNKLGKKDSALVELQSILSELNPDAWIFNNVQEKLESIFLKSKDLDGLVKFYEKRLATDPRNLPCMVRLSKHLQSLSRNEDARNWIHRAIALAPSRKDHRKSLIELLVADKQWREAGEQYQRLAELDPKNLDTLRAWGLMVLRDPTLESTEAKKSAQSIWERMIDIRPTDATLHVQVAELIVSAGLPEQAQKYFERAVELQADNPQYLEYLGNFHFAQHRREKAFEIWETMTAGSFRSAESLLRLAEIYQRADLNRAADRASEACVLTANDRSVRLRAADIQRQAGRTDDALVNLSMAEKLSEGEAEKEIVTERRLNVLEESHRLGKEAEKLLHQLELGVDSDSSQWRLLARYFVRLGKWKNAEEAIAKAIAIEPDNIASLALLVDIHSTLGDLSQSTSTLKRLIVLDSNKRAEYLGKIAKLQVRGGDKEGAISSARQLVEAKPSSVDSYLLLADICSQLKEGDLAIEALRKALRLEPRSKLVSNYLSSVFMNQQKYQEAIELYWQSFERSESLDEKLELTSKLADAYSKQGKIEALIEILEHDRKNVDVRSDLSQCLACVYSTKSDFAKALAMLAELLTTNPDDPKLLEQLVTACSAARDLDSAVKYQRQLVAIASDAQHEAHLATLLRSKGDNEGAQEIAVRLLQNEPSPLVLVKTLDECIVRGEYQLVKQTAESVLQKVPDNWELIYRLAVAYAEMGQMQDALAAFERILEMRVNREDSSYRGQLQLDPARDPTGAQPVALPVELSLELETLCLPGLTTIAQGQFAKGANRHWTPKTFGELRMASLAWLAYCNEMGSPSRLVLAHRSKAERRHLSNQALLDALALARFQRDSLACLEIMELMANRGERAVLPLYLQAIQERSIGKLARIDKNALPLSDTQNCCMLTAFDEVHNPPSIHWNFVPPTNYVASLTPQFARRAGWSRPSVIDSGFVKAIVEELIFAGKTKEAEDFLSQKCNSATEVYHLSTLCEYLLTAKRLDLIEEPLLRWFSARRASYDAGAKSVMMARSNEADPTEFAARFVDACGGSMPWSTASKLVAASMDEDNLRMETHSFDPIDLSSIAFKLAVRVPTASHSIKTSPTQVRFSNFDSFYVRLLAERVLVQQNQELSARNERWKEFFDARIDRARGDLKPMERLRLGCFLEDPLLLPCGPRVANALKDIAAQPGNAIHAAAAMLQNDLLDEAESTAFAARPIDRQAAVAREFILICAAKLRGDKATLGKRLAGFDFKNLDRDVYGPLFSYLPEAAQYAQKGNAASAGPIGLAGPTGPKVGVVPRGQTLGGLGQGFPGPQQPPFPFPGPQRPQGGAGKTTAPLDPRVKELNRLEAAVDKSAVVSYARSILLKPDELFVPSRPLLLQIRTIHGTPSPMYASSGSKKNRDPARGVALAVLRREGDLIGFCEDVEQRIQRSPDSFLLHSLLAECYEAQGDNDAADRALREAVRIRPTASETRLYWVDFLYRIGRSPDAAIQFLELLKRDPELALCEISYYPGMFEQASIATETIDLIKNSDLSSVVQQHSIMLSGVILTKSSNCFEIGASILERQFEFHPFRSHEALEHLYLTIGSDFPRMMNFTASAFIPADRNAIRSVWYGYHNSSSVLRGRDDLLCTILRAHSLEVISGELREPIASAVDRMPDWLGGKLMLASILGYQKIDQPALALLNDLAKSIEVERNVPDAVLKSLAMELGRFPQHQSQAIRMLTTLSAKSIFAHEGHDVKLALAKIWVQRDNREKAMETLMSNDPFGFRNRRDFMGGGIHGVSYDEAERFAHGCRSIGLPIESFFYYSHPNFPRRKTGQTREEGIAETIRMIENLPADKAIEELLFDRTRFDLQNSALELMFEPPRLRHVAKQPMECVLHRELMRHAVGGKSNEIAKALDDLAFKHPDDLSAALARTRWNLETGIGDSEDAIKELEQILSSPKGGVNRSQVFSVWFIARRCYELKKHVEFADRFAAQALTAARELDNTQINITTSDQSVSFDQPRRENASSLLLEWGKSLLQIGEDEKGTSKWKEMIQEATKHHRSPTEWIEVVEQWGIKTGKADKCMDLLLPVFSGDSIQIYPVSSDSEILANQANSVASVLVRFAKQSHRLKELVALSESRKSDDIHNLVFRTQIAIAEGDFDLAKSMLMTIPSKFQPDGAREGLETACHAAIPAFEHPVLQPEARPILLDFIHRMETDIKYKSEDFNSLPLVKKVRGSTP